MKVKIIDNNGLNGITPWYSDKIGEVFEVSESGALLGDTNWRYLVINPELPDICHGVQEYDCEVVQEDKFLEDAWDEPDSTPWTEAVNLSSVDTVLVYDNKHYKYPATKEQAPKKKSAEQIVADAFNQERGTSLTEVDLVDIINAVSVLKKLEK